MRTSAERRNFEMNQTGAMSKTHWTIEADLTGKPGSDGKSPGAVTARQKLSDEEAPGQPKIKGVKKHEKVVSNLMTEGKKFRETLKYGFPVQARKTMQNSS